MTNRQIEKARALTTLTSEESELLPMCSVHPDGVTRQQIAWMASELMACRQLRVLQHHEVHAINAAFRKVDQAMRDVESVLKEIQP